MAESVLVRVRRLVSASIEDLVDRMEAAGGPAVMAEAIREVERAADEVRAERDAATARRLMARRQQTAMSKRMVEMEDKAEFALAQGREDLAEVSLLRQTDLEAHALKLVEGETAAGEEEERLAAMLASLEARRSVMQEELDAFVAARREAGALAGCATLDDPVQRSQRIDRRVREAESAFARTMKRTGEASAVGTVDRDAMKKMGELDALERSAKVADKMAALRARVAARVAAA